MKNFKKLSILLLSLVMVFSCFAVLSLAEETDEAAKIAEIESLLEYYDEEGIYICDAFDGANAGGGIVFDTDSEGAYGVVDGKDVWTATLDGGNVLYSPDIALPDDYKSVVFVYGFRVDAEESNEDKGYLALELSGDSTTEALTEGQSIFVLDYKEGKAYFASMNAAQEVSRFEIEGFVPENGVWYTLSMVYNRRTNTFEGKIAAAGEEGVAFTYQLAGIFELSEITLRSRNVGNAGVTVSWDLLEIYEGTFVRSNLAEQRQKELDAKVLAIMKEYATASVNLKRAIISTVDALLDQGYAPIAGSDTEKYFDEQHFGQELTMYYWEEFASKVDSFDTTLKYAVRYQNLEAAKKVDADFPAKPGGVAPSTYEAVKAKYNAELAALEEIAEYSAVLVDAVRADTNGMNYEELLAWILDFEAAREKLLRADGTYDDTYSGVAVALDLYRDVLARLLSLKNLSLQFIAAVDQMNRQHSTDFGVKHNAYLLAKSIVDDAMFADIVDSYTANFSFVEDEMLVIYDGKEYPILSVAENGKSAVVSINAFPYTVTVQNYKLTLVGEGMTIVFKPVGDFNSGISLSGDWTAATTVADALADFENRDDFIIEGAEICNRFINAVSAALKATGYNGRVTKRDEILENYSDVRPIFEEGGDYFGFDGLAKALVDFDAFCETIATDKENADVFIELTVALKAASAYLDIKAIVEEAAPYAALLGSNMEDYENEICALLDASNEFYKMQTYVSKTENDAQIFVQNVEDACLAVKLETRLALLRAAQKIALTLPEGATGFAEASVIFEQEKQEYLNDAAMMNSVASQEGEKLVQIAFANLKTAVAQKVVFIIKKVYEL